MFIVRALRSLIFNVFYAGWTLAVACIFLPPLCLPGRRSMLVARVWGIGVIYGARLICGIRWREEGREHLPQGPCILMSKHQSSWETAYFPVIFQKPIYVLKKELLSIPFVGWHLSRTGMIAVDRQAGAGAMKGMLRGVEDALQRGSQIIFFPEGTRTVPDTDTPFQPGTAALYGRFGKNVPIIPVALNTGLFWGRGSFMRYPGEIVIRYLPPVTSDIDRRAFSDYVERQIHDVSRDLCASYGLPE